MAGNLPEGWGDVHIALGSGGCIHVAMGRGIVGGRQGAVLGLDAGHPHCNEGVGDTELTLGLERCLHLRLGKEMSWEGASTLH